MPTTIQCTGGFSLKDSSGNIVATISYLPSLPEYPGEVLEIRIVEDGYGLVLTGAGTGLVDNHTAIEVGTVDYFPF